MSKRVAVNWCQGFCRTCGTACAETTREILELRADRDGWMQLAGRAELEVERLTKALQAIAAKGEASPGDKKAAMAKAALDGAGACTPEGKRV